MKQEKKYKNRLKDLREDRDLTQDQLVAILQMNKTTYTRYEQGICDLPLEIAKKLALLYDVSLDYLAGLISKERKIDGSPRTYGKNNVIISGGTGHKIDMH